MCGLIFGGKLMAKPVTPCSIPQVKRLRWWMQVSGGISYILVSLFLLVLLDRKLPKNINWVQPATITGTKGCQKELPQSNKIQSIHLKIPMTSAQNFLHVSINLVSFISHPIEIHMANMAQTMVFPVFPFTSQANFQLCSSLVETFLSPRRFHPPQSVDVA